MNENNRSVTHRLEEETMHNTWRAITFGVVVGLAALAAAGFIAAPVQAGSLEPPADAVDAMGNPKSTGATYPAWDKLLDSTNGDITAGRVGCDSDRFTCVMNDEAVRDNETGLVWERSPDTTPRTWTSAIRHCANRTVGSWKGWELPMRHQLARLVDPDNPAGNPAFLPPGHPFSNVQLGLYWSATTGAGNPAVAWRVDFNNGSVFANLKTITFHVWCVRGGQSFDGNTHSTVH